MSQFSDAAAAAKFARHNGWKSASDLSAVSFVTYTKGETSITAEYNDKRDLVEFYVSTTGLDATRYTERADLLNTLNGAKVATDPDADENTVYAMWRVFSNAPVARVLRAGYKSLEEIIFFIPVYEGQDMAVEIRNDITGKLIYVTKM